MRGRVRVRVKVRGRWGWRASRAGRGAVLVIVQLLPTTAIAAPRTVRCMPGDIYMMGDRGWG